MYCGPFRSPGACRRPCVPKGGPAIGKKQSSSDTAVGSTEPGPPRILTVGHSARPLEEFIDLLRAHGVTRLVDVRKMPRSRRNPQFNADALPASLRQAGIRYVAMPGLGGLRRRRPDSPNAGWKNASFQGYADYMLTPEFDRSLQELIELAQGERVALMCAEAVPWRCHRSLIADALLVRGLAVEHILTEKRTQRHTLKPWAKVEGTRLTYPPADAETETHVQRP